MQLDNLKFIAFMLLLGATTTDICDNSIHRVCKSDNEPKHLPETAEELQEFCNFAIDFFRCGVEYTEKCEDNDILKTRSFLKVFEEVCNEDTLLYATAVDNLHCFNELRMKGPDEECHRLNISPSVETLDKYAKALAEEGHSVFSDDESEVNNTLRCIPMLQELACYGTKLEDKCGTIAMDTYVELVKKFGPVAECGETYDYLSTVIRVYKLEKEEVDDTAEILKKKK